MSAVLSGRQLFSPGTAEKFSKIDTNLEFREKVTKIIELGRPVRDAHLQHSPNKSYKSTLGALQSADRLVNGNGHDIKNGQEDFFGNHIREAIDIVKDFLKK